MKKLLFFMAAMLQTALLMAQNPVKKSCGQNNAVSSGQTIIRNQAALSENQPSRPLFIIAPNDGNLPQDRVPSPPGPNDPIPIVIYQFK